MKLFLILTLVTLSKVSFAQFLKEPLDEIQRSHIDSNLPDKKKFDSLLKEELKKTFKKTMPSISKIDYELLRVQPTQSGLSYPKFYAWVKIYNKFEWPEFVGAIRFATIEKKRIDITDILDIDQIQNTPNSIASIFPSMLVDNIKERARKSNDAFSNCFLGEKFQRTSRLQVENGYFLGTDNGEWIGTLEFYPKNGEKYKILTKNVKAIIKLQSKIVVLTGLGHLNMDTGEISELYLDGKTWKIKQKHNLPGEPISYENLNSSKLKIKTRKGIISFDPNSGNKTLSCPGL